MIVHVSIVSCCLYPSPGNQLCSCNPKQPRHQPRTVIEATRQSMSSPASCRNCPYSSLTTCSAQAAKQSTQKTLRKMSSTMFNLENPGIEITTEISTPFKSPVQRCHGQQDVSDSPGLQQRHAAPCCACEGRCPTIERSLPSLSTGGRCASELDKSWPNHEVNMSIRIK